MSDRRRQWPVGRLVAGVLVVGGALLAWRLLSGRTVPVELVEVVRAPLEVTVDEEGRTEVHDRYVVASPITGRLSRIGLLPGDPVRPGMPVAEVRPQPLDPRASREAGARYEALLDAERSAVAGVEATKVALEQARRDLVRSERLATERAISPQALEQARLQVASLEQQLRSAQAAAERAAHEVEAGRSALLSADVTGRGGALVVRAPVAGRVLRVLQPSERVVLVGTPLLEVGNTTHLDVVVEMLSTDAVRVRPGDTMRIGDWGGNEPLVALVERIEPTATTKVSALGIEEQRVRVVGALPSPPAALGDGFRVETHTVVWRADSAVQVPSTALFQHDAAWHVYAVAGGRARMRRVGVGQRNATMTEIREGLAPGDTVLRHPSDQVKEGVRVSPLRER